MLDLKELRIQAHLLRAGPLLDLVPVLLVLPVGAFQLEHLQDAADGVQTVVVQIERLHLRLIKQSQILSNVLLEAILSKGI